MKTNTNNRPQHVRLMLLEQMPAQVRHLVASSTALDTPSGNAHGFVWTHHNDDQNGQQSSCMSSRPMVAAASGDAMYEAICMAI
jgi:hypothetical protein